MEPIVIDRYGAAVDHLLLTASAAPAQLAITRTASGELVPVYVVSPFEPQVVLPAEVASALSKA